MALTQQQLDAMKRITAQQKGIAPAVEMSREEARNMLSSKDYLQDTKAKQNNIFERAKSSISQLVGGLKQDFTQRAETQIQAGEAYAKGDQGFLRTYGQVTGQYLGAVGDVFGESMKSVFHLLPEDRQAKIKSGVSSIISDIAEAQVNKFERMKQEDPAKADKIQSLIDNVTMIKNEIESDPAKKRDFEALLGATEVLGLGLGERMAKETLTGTVEVGKSVLSGVGTAGKDFSRMATDSVVGATEKMSSGLNFAKEAVPTREGMVSGQIAKALDLTQGDISNIKLSTKNDVGNWIAEKNLIGQNKGETVTGIKNFVDTQYKSVRDEIAKVPTVYGRIPRIEDSLQMLKSETKGILGQEAIAKEVDDLLGKELYSLSDAQRVKELLDNQFNLYKATGDVREGQAKAGLANVRKDLKQFIESEVKDHTGADISNLNNDVATGQSILKLTEKRSTRDFTRANVSLSDLGVFGSGSIVGTPLFGAAALIAKRIMETPAVRLKFAKFLNSLPKKEAEQISASMIKGEVPEKVKAIVGEDFSEATVPETVFEKAKGLSAVDREIETKAFEKIANQEKQILQDYTKKYGKVVNTDNFRPFFKDVGYKGYNAASVQEPASYLSKKAFVQALNNEGKYATLYAGGSGTGKSSAIKGLNDVTKTIADSAVVLDSNLSSMGSAISKIEQAVNAGKIPQVVYVYREPVDSMVNGVVKRGLQNVDEAGRIVPTKITAGNHIDSWDVVKELHSKGMLVTFIDNSLGAKKAKVSSFEELSKKISYPSKAELTSTFNKEIKKLYDAGTITGEVYNSYIT